MARTKVQNSAIARANVLPAPRRHKLPLGWSLTLLSIGCGAFWALLLKAVL